MAQPAAIARLLGELAPAMERHGFQQQSDRSVWTGKFNIFSWQRRTWKTDVVRLQWRVGPASTCLLDGQWSVTIDGADRQASALNAIYARRGVNLVALPRWWPLVGGWLEARWRAALVADAEHVLAWCARTATRDGALEDLRDPDRNGPPAGSEAFRVIERHVIDCAPIGTD